MKKTVRIALGIIVFLLTWSVGSAILAVLAPAVQMGIHGLVSFVVGIILMILIITYKPQSKGGVKP